MRNYFLFLQVTWQIPSKLSKNKKYLFLNGERYEQPDCTLALMYLSIT